MVKPLFLVLSAGMLAGAQSPPPQSGRPAQLERLLGCRGLTDTQQRLECYDRETAAFEAARSRKELVVVDRQQIRSTQRSLFGLTLPRIPFLDGDGKDREASGPQQIEGTVRSVRVTREGKWVVQVDEAVWQTTEVAAFDTPPRVGSKAVIRRAALGSFVLAVEGKKALRAIRLR